MSETEKISIREFSNVELANALWKHQNWLETVVSEIQYRQENDLTASGELPTLEDRGRFNQTKTEFHLYLDLL